MEIYNEVVMDLLAKRGDKASQASGLKIRLAGLIGVLQQP